jgi:hypothetical protein
VRCSQLRGDPANVPVSANNFAVMLLSDAGCKAKR